MIEQIFTFILQLDWLKYLITAIVIFFLLCYLVKKGISIDLKNKNITFFSKKANQIRCILCSEELIRIIKNSVNLSVQITEEGNKCKDNLTNLLSCEMENIDCKIGEFFDEILNEQLNKKQIQDPRMKVILLKLNMQLLNLVWIVKRHEIVSLFRTSICQNHFSDFSALDLRTFSSNKFSIFITRMLKLKAFPDFSDDTNFIIDREEFISYLKERMFPIMQDVVHNIYFQAQQIRKNHEKNITEITEKINNSGPDFMKKREKILEAIEK